MINKLIIYAIIAISFPMLSGCVGVAYSKKIAQHYYLSALDTEQEMELTLTDKDDYSFVIVPATVTAVGYDARYIIAKQLSAKDFGGSDRTKFNYFIVPIKEMPTSDDAEKIIGPLTLEEFSKRKNALGINFDFTIAFPNLE